MRVLFVCWPQTGHLHPLIPLANALSQAGHEVRFATGASVRERIERAGFAVDLVGPTGVEVGIGLLAEQVGGEPGAGLAPNEVLAWFVPRLCTTMAEHTLPDLLAVMERVRPDLVIYETASFAAPLAAAMAGVPSVQHSYGLLLPVEIYRLAAAHLAPLWRRHGLAPEPFGGSFRNLCFSIAPAALETPVDESVRGRVHPLRPVGFSAPTAEALPDWVRALGERPTVYVTMGTFFANQDVFRAVLEGLADEPVNVIITIGRDHAEDWLDPLPANARVAQYIPQALLLPHCAAVVSHGGSGTILPALGAGLPQVVLPQGADNFLNAERCQAAGVGLVLWPGEVTPDAVRRAVRATLDDPVYRQAARRLADQIAQMPCPNDVLAALAALPGAYAS